MTRSELKTFLIWGMVALSIVAVTVVVAMTVESFTPVQTVEPVSPPPTALPEPLPIAKPATPPSTKRVFSPVLIQTYWYDTSTYTPWCDGGKPDRPTAAVNFLAGGKRATEGYPRKWTTLRHTIETGAPICAVSYRERWIHERLVQHPGGVMLHRYRVRFPWYDAPGVLRLPIDRVPAKTNRFDMFMHMPPSQAKKHGVALMPVEIYEMRWIDVQEEGQGS